MTGQGRLHFERRAEDYMAMPPTIRKATTEPGVEPGRRPFHTMEGLLGVLILLTLGLQQYQLAPFGWIMLGEFAAVLAFWATW